MTVKQPKQLIIKKYANRRLYDTQASQYITLDDLRQMVKQEVDFKVEDAKTGADLTHSVLIQIIFDSEAKKQQIFPVSFLRQTIALYDDKLGQVLPSYLQTTMDNFMQNQEQMRSFMEQQIDEYSPMKVFEEISRKNLDMMGQTFDAFTRMNPMMGGKDDK